MNLLGYSTPFAQIECLKLIASPSYTDKRVGYLALVQMFAEDSDILLMVTNTLKIDLGCMQSPLIQSLVLTAIGEMATPDMCKELYAEVKKQMQNGNTYIRKKATLAAIRIIRKVPDMAEEFAKLIDSLLSEKSHSSVLTATALMKEICLCDKSYCLKFAKHTNFLVKTLKALIGTGIAAEYEIGNVTDPFLQVAVLQILRLIGKGNVEASDEMNDILAQLASSTDASKGAGNAVLYEVVKVIFGIESSTGLKTTAINILGKFLEKKENNPKFIALECFKLAIKFDENAVQRQKAAILECIKDQDFSIKKAALDLMHQISNKSNAKGIVKGLLPFLTNTESEFNTELANTICQIAEANASSRKWLFDISLKIYSLAGSSIKDEHLYDLIHLIIGTPQLHAYCVGKAFFAAKEYQYQEALTILALWLLGEYPQYINKAIASDNTPIDVKDEEILDLIDKIISNTKVTNRVKEYSLNTLFKLSVKKTNLIAQIKVVAVKLQSSKSIEIQQRACEYVQLMSSDWDSKRSSLLNNVVSNKKGKELLIEYEKIKVVSDDEADQVPASNDAKAANAEPQDQSLVNLLDENLLQQKKENKPTDLLNELFSTNIPAAEISNKTNSPAIDLTMLSSTTSTKVAEDKKQEVNLVDISLSPPKVDGNGTIIKAYSDFNMAIDLEIFKCEQKGENNIIVHYTSSSHDEISDVNLQIAVQKFVKLSIEPASGTVLPSMAKNGITQSLKIANTAFGEKQVSLKMKINYKIRGGVTSEVKVIQLPAL